MTTIILPSFSILTIAALLAVLVSEGAPGIAMSLGLRLVRYAQRAADRQQQRRTGREDELRKLVTL